MIPGIAERDRAVASEAGTSGPGDGGSPEPPGELLIVEREAFDQVGRRDRTACAVLAGAGIECGRGEAVVDRARLLAEIAAERPCAHQRAQLLRDGAPMLDGQIRDAAPGVDDPGRDDRTGGT